VVKAFKTSQNGRISRTQRATVGDLANGVLMLLFAKNRHGEVGIRFVTSKKP
jgi:hypothetical protein